MQTYVHVPVEGAPPDQPHWESPHLSGIYWLFQTHLDGVDIYISNTYSRRALLVWGNAIAQMENTKGLPLNPDVFSPAVIMACELVGYERKR